jgi:hypothetical protein
MAHGPMLSRNLVGPWLSFSLTWPATYCWVYSAWRGPLLREETEATLDFLYQLDLDLKAIFRMTQMHPAFEERFRRRLEARTLARE